MISESVELCEKLWFASYTSKTFLEQMNDFQKRTMFHPMSILNPQDLPLSQSPETVPISIVSQYYT